MQDRVVGPLTLFQFLYLLAGGMVFYTTLKTPNPFDLLIGIPAGLLSLALAFLKINDQPFSRFIISFLFFLIHPKKRVWHHGEGSTEISVTKETKSANQRVVRKAVSADQLARIAATLDKGTS